jgi:anthranilate phosphoribosyltransferase
VFSSDWLEPLAHVLKNLGSQHVLIVNAEDGLDEISIASASNITELKNGIISSYQVTPEQFGLQRASLDSLAVDSAQSSLAMINDVFNNQAGAAKDIVLLNSGAAIYAANLTNSLEDGVEKARLMIENGAALEKFEQLATYSNK